MESAAHLDDELAIGFVEGSLTARGMAALDEEDDSATLRDLPAVQESLEQVVAALPATPH